MVTSDTVVRQARKERCPPPRRRPLHLPSPPHFGSNFFGATNETNEQLPTEGKKFAMVDKNWRQTISSAKSNSKVIDFCNSSKLLERFK